ncbi:MAG: 2-keto-4-pentenoate hydratase, partial [Myxococcaceae bacterium]
MKGGRAFRSLPRAIFRLRKSAARRAVRPRCPGERKDSVPVDGVLETTTDTTTARRAAEILWEHWRQRTRIDALPDSVRPHTRAEGYAIQREVQACAGQALAGWKIAATSSSGQRHIGVDGPMAGRMLAQRSFRSGAEAPLAGSLMRVAEPEFAFTFGRDLAPRAAPYTSSEVLDAVAGLHPAIEVPDSRYADFVHAGEAQLIADNACADYFVLGAAALAPWRGLDLVAHRVSAEVVGRYAREGCGANVLGDPRVALTWLVNELSG